MKKNIKILLIIELLVIFLLSANASSVKIIEKNKIEEQKSFIEISEENEIPLSSEFEDIDPLIDLNITITIKEIRAFDKIDFIGKPDLYVKLIVNNQTVKSPTWRNKRFINESWSQTFDVPDDMENVSIKIQLWEDDLFKDKICDLSENDGYFRACYDIDLVYNLKTAHWYGDDFISSSFWSDSSGYGRVNGCDDNSIYQIDRDCELWFEITQNDYDGDGIPYWAEVNVFGTDPSINNIGMDDDLDGVPIEWEFKWGYRLSYDWYNHTIGHKWIYDPFKYEDHSNLDPDSDGLNNVEEYLTSQWGSDPFRKDIYIELDQMEAGSNGEPASLLPNGSKDLLRDAFDKHNIVLHIDDGSMGGGEMIPFDKDITQNNGKLQDIYKNYFLHGDNNNWRRGIFHYGIVVYDANYSGYVFGVENDSYFGAFQISSSRVNKKVFVNTPRRRSVTYASVYMHELGHTLDINIPGGHDTSSQAPWQIGWWKWRPYKSCMNYGYTYFLVDYSDGSRGKNDHDDWSNLDLTYFQIGV